MFMRMAPPSETTVRVRRRAPVLVAPAKPTPRETKPLSDIDDQHSLRYHVRMLQLYAGNPRVEGRDPAKVLKEALGDTLVFYYPLAGRLREGPGRKLAVDCTGEGVLFVEADAAFSLDQLGCEDNYVNLHPPFPDWVLDDLLCDVADDDGAVLHRPLLFVQVTRLRCGGFAFGVAYNHAVLDAGGLFKFMEAVAEIARGAHAPSVPPVWDRERLNARDPPRLSRAHAQTEADRLGYSRPSPRTTTPPGPRIVHYPFFIRPAELRTLGNRLRSSELTCTSFELLTGYFWRCRTRAVRLLGASRPDEEARVVFTVNAQSKFRPRIPVGYYGSAFAFAFAVAPAAELCDRELDYAVALVKEAKAKVTEAYIRDVADLMVIAGRPGIVDDGAYGPSDLSQVPFLQIDFGWGPPVYGGPARLNEGPFQAGTDFHIRVRNGVVVTVGVPEGPAEAKLASEVQSGLRPTSFRPSL